MKRKEERERERDKEKMKLSFFINEIKIDLKFFSSVLCFICKKKRGDK